MTYQWKLPGLYPVDAQTAGEELRRIYDSNGQLTASEVVDESRPADAPLHPVFEWDDPTAAELYREHQARQVIRSVVVQAETVTHAPVEVRAMVKLDNRRGYQPIDVVVSDRLDSIRLLEQAMSELRAFERKYEALSQLRPVFDAMHGVTA